MPDLPDLPVDPDVAGGDLPRTATAPGLVAVVRQRWDVLLVIAAGGAVGSLARWGADVALPTTAGGFPWSTFLVNVVGAFALGLLMLYVVDVWRPSRYVRPFLGVGVLGGFTTFSTYMVQTRDLLAGGHAATAAAYLVGTLLVGLPAAFAGLAAGRAIAGGGRSTA